LNRYFLPGQQQRLYCPLTELRQFSRMLQNSYADIFIGVSLIYLSCIIFV
jgi:hypothetical protein